MATAEASGAVSDHLANEAAVGNASRDRHRLIRRKPGKDFGKRCFVAIDQGDVRVERRQQAGGSKANALRGASHQDIASGQVHGIGHHCSWRSKVPIRSEEHTSELQSLMRISYAVFCLKKIKPTKFIAL